MHRSLLFHAVAFALAVAGTARADVDITSCGTEIEAGETGVLQADVACAGPGQTGVLLGSGATLDLNGHSLSGGANGVFCTTSCTIQGPGEISGFSAAGITSSTNPRPRISVFDVDVHDNLTYGIVLNTDGKLTLHRVVVTGNNHGGIAVGPGSNLDRGSVTGIDITVSGNHGIGVKARKVKLTDSDVLDNDGTGILGGGAKTLLIGSAVMNNGLDFDPGYDLKTFKRPKLKESTCTLSGKLEDDASVSGPWGVCTGD